MASHITYFMANNIIGPVSNLHQAMCEIQSSEYANGGVDEEGNQKPRLGSDDPECLRVAKMVGFAHDLQKNGQIVAVSEVRDYNELVK